MAHHKVLIDNTICSRRFHVTYDDRDKVVDAVNLKCPYCGITVFSRSNHPPAQLVRQENLVQTAELSDEIVQECKFRDVFSEKTVRNS